MESYVRTVSKTCRYHLRNISRIRHVLSDDACRTIIQALVTSRLDYSNALLYGLPTKITSHLQRVQNTAARVNTPVPFSALIIFFGSLTSPLNL